MADSDYDAISPIQSLQTVRSLSPTQRREERREQQSPEEEPKEPDEEMTREEEPDETDDGPGPRRGGDSHLVDYCA